ncbi:phosphatidylethanolamine N-methyltransferase [Geosmithia morbida]|uniref:Phosphatidylethanolamine N-methyltransferase n=1 Tax=Geosmithia morbida TaxID=1094350 RepID=A0A9P5D3W4_9HYPO|nr:phosphatidylethanolamine N-methyltransferase [Geosmithia morbida]KAF4126663.1 phosphatidylethanolamine N-methyltransferase [Geosmithia morbida]
MTTPATNQGAVDAAELRQRAPHGSPSGDNVGPTDAGTTCSTAESGSTAEVKGKKTYGRTPDGTVFIVPTTHDMVSQLLDPRQPKNLSDATVLAILGALIALAYLLPATWKKPVFALVFLFWRAAYNAGIGLLLHHQSHHRRLITWARRWKLFEKPDSGNQPRPWLYNFLKKELEIKIPEDYEFEKAPLEYNTWLVFRRVVDLILMCDFVSYCLFAVICGHRPEEESLTLGIARWVFGITLVGFNLWVKLDAHRVVKDFAWYWGDFFYLIDQDLTFDGVFEMAPHPMYSIGYAGFYGISMMAASYEVLFISIAAHLAQFAFLVTVENPHIEKTYNPPPPRKRSEARSQSDSQLMLEVPSDQQPSAVSMSRMELPYPVHDMVGLGNIDLFRVPDVAVILLPSYVAALTFATPSTPVWQGAFVMHALAWRLWYHLALGIILDQQSKTKMWTRHFLKFGESAGEAWRQWKGLHHIFQIMANASFMAACWKMYNAPEDWTHGLVLLKHVLGASLVALQLWTAFSVYDSLGEFGWFCGDFFFDQRAKLTYTSIYRFVNNPERVFGIAGTWGAALITWSRSIFLLAMMTQLLTLWYITYVERPHMQKVYGMSLRREAGLTKFIKRQLPSPVRTWSESVDKVLDETTHFVEDFIDTARPKFASGMKTVVRDTTALFNVAPARLTITRISPDLEGLNPKYYALSVSGTEFPTHSGFKHRSTGKESLNARFPKEVKTRVYEYGTPLKVTWRAPANHSKSDWIGLYMVTDNRSREATEVSSLGRWAPTNERVYDAMTADVSITTPEHSVPADDGSDVDMVSGEVAFHGDKLWWTQGVFEFRYHHDGKHTAMAISEPFEIRIAKFVADDDDDNSVDGDGVVEKFNSQGISGAYEAAVEEAILPVVQNCLDRDPDISPCSVDEPFGSHVERDSKYSKRVVYAIREMFGIEFAPAVVMADGNVRKLAWRICNAKQVLVSLQVIPSKEEERTEADM